MVSQLCRNKSSSYQNTYLLLNKYNLSIVMEAMGTTSST